MPAFRIPLRLAAFSAFTCIAPAHAQGSASFADPALIDRAVEQFTGAPIGVTGGAAQPVDRRLRLASCQAPLSLGWHGSRQDSVLVECPDAGSWRIYVPVAKASAAATKQAMLVARGDAVNILVRGTGFSVTQTGQAMEAGGKDDWIRVKPPGGAEPVRAQVERPGLVIIPL